MTDFLRCQVYYLKLKFGGKTSMDYEDCCLLDKLIFDMMKEIDEPRAKPVTQKDK